MLFFLKKRENKKKVKKKGKLNILLFHCLNLVNDYEPKIYCI